MRKSLTLPGWSARARRVLVQGMRFRADWLEAACRLLALSDGYSAWLVIRVSWQTAGEVWLVPAGVWLEGILPSLAPAMAAWGMCSDSGVTGSV
jgi:hypothetical protein